MLQAALLDCLFLYLCPFSEDGLIAPEVDFGRRDVVQALVISLVVVIGECPIFCVSVIWFMLPDRSKDDDDF